MNRYVVGAILSAILGGLYLYLSGTRLGQPDFEKATGIVLTTVAVVITIRLFVDVTNLKPVQLGELQHEHSSVALALFFSMAYMGFSIGNNFYDLYKPRSGETTHISEATDKAGEWIYDD